MKQIEVCHSPALIPLYNTEGKIVVVIDIFRATSSICYGIENGALEIIPVATVAECAAYEGKGYLLAAERNGEVVEGFNFGNSPFSYTPEKVNGQKIVLTTTNGTHAIKSLQATKEIIIGSFLNLTAICNYLIAQNTDVLLLCSGWKDKFNLEDTLYAGAVAQQLIEAGYTPDDAAIGAETMYTVARPNMREYLKRSSHTIRLQELNIEDDIQFCLKTDIISTIPVIVDGKIVKKDLKIV